MSWLISATIGGVLDGGTSVIVQTSNGTKGAGNGTITVTDSISMNSASNKAATLTLVGNGDVVVNAAIAGSLTRPP